MGRFHQKIFGLKFFSFLIIFFIHSGEKKNLKLIVERLRLVLLDEVQILGEDRGGTLEAAISRIKISMDKKNVRFIAISATCPNAFDIGNWLLCKKENVRVFGEEYRPVKLTTHVLAFPQGKSEYLFNQNLKYKLFDTILAYFNKRPTLIFCGSRKETVSSAQQVIKDAIAYTNIFVPSDSTRNKLTAASVNITDKILKECVIRGVGFYHAGLCFTDRDTIQSLFEKGNLMVVCTTSSLSKGVNFPAHLVIIQGTQVYSTSKYHELSVIDVTQMIGRAGRPQFDTTGTAVILTRDCTKQRYQNLISGQENVESTLLNSLASHLNSEIVVGSIKNSQDADHWLKSTFLFCRIISNPQHYSIPSGLIQSKIEQHLQQIVQNALKDLRNHEFIKTNSDHQFIPLDSGICMSQFYIEFETMKKFKELDKENVSLEEIILLLSNASEFQQITLRRSEKTVLNQLHQSVRFQLEAQGKKKKKLQLIKTNNDKIFILVQSILGDLEIKDWALKQEAAMVLIGLSRILKGLISYLMNKKRRTALVNTILLNQSIQQKIWFDSIHVCRQIDKIGIKFSRVLADNGITSLEKLEQCNPRKIEEILNRNIPFGIQVQNSLTKIWPKHSLDAKMVDKKLEVHVKAQTPIPKTNTKFSPGNYSTLIIGEKHSDKILLVDHMIPNFSDRSLEFKIPLGTEPVICDLLNNDFVGMNISLGPIQASGTGCPPPREPDVTEEDMGNYEDDLDLIPEDPSEEQEENEALEEEAAELSSPYFQTDNSARIAIDKLNKYKFVPKSPFPVEIGSQSTTKIDQQITNLLNQLGKCQQDLNEERKQRIELDKRVRVLESKSQSVGQLVTQEFLKPKEPLPLHPERTQNWFSMAKNHAREVVNKNEKLL